MSSNSPDTSTTNDLARQRTDMAGNRTRWAADRTFWATDRTQIAWIRTAISLIGFGFAIAKAGDALESKGIFIDDFHSVQIVGVTFIALAGLGLIGAVIQSLRIERRLANQGFKRIEPMPLGLVMSILVLAVGIFGVIAIFR